ncbi:MAG: rRNA maturation RNase YbeY [candidate division Zixibacteria bacterium]|nr:rRNA maturation RNase YbeY [candidate division Zixibacteria bacterium]
MQFNIISVSNRRTPRKKIIQLMSAIKDKEGAPNSSVNINFIDDYRISRLNEEFRKKTGPTDVLSFNLDDDEGPDSVLGEIYISTDTAEKNAKLNKLTYTDEILRLCCHGFLHLLGYDHISKEDRKKMEEKEDYYLGRFS